MAIRSIEFDIALKSSTRQAQPKIPIAYAGDSGSIQLRFTLTDTTAEELMGARAEMFLSVNNSEPRAATINGNTVVYTLTEAETIPGMMEIDLQVYFSGGQILGSPKVQMEIQETLKNKYFSGK